MLKSVENVVIEHPTTKKKLAKDQDPSGKITTHWTTVSCCMTAVELQQVKNAKEMTRNMELHGKLEAQLEASELVLTESEFEEVQAMVLAFPNFLRGGILFGNLFRIMQAPEIREDDYKAKAKKKEAEAPKEDEPAKDEEAKA